MLLLGAVYMLSRSRRGGSKHRSKNYISKVHLKYIGDKESWDRMGEGFAQPVSNDETYTHA